MHKEEILKFAKENFAFYKNLFKNIDENAQWIDYPLFEKDEFRKGFNNLITNKGISPCYLLTTGGSSAKKTFIPLSFSEIKQESISLGNSLNKNFFFSNKGQEIILDLTHAGNLGGSFLLISKALEHVNALSIPLLGNFNEQIALEIANNFKITTIIGIVSNVDRFVNLLKKENITINIKHALFAGEKLYPDQRVKWQETLGTNSIQSFCYASVDCGLIAEPLLGDATDQFKVLNECAYLEILDENAIPITKNGVIGSIYITNLYRKTLPIIRYPIGDQGSWINYRENTFRLEKRNSLSLKLGSIIYEYNTLFSQLKEFLGGDFKLQLIANRKDSFHLLNINIAIDNCSYQRRDIADYLETIDEKKYRLNRNDNISLSIQLIDSRDLIYSDQSGKFKTVIDKRTTND